MLSDTRADVMADARFELRVRQIAPPLVLAIVALAFSLPTLAGIGRVFLSMWLHELGHASSAWLCGFAAVPGPWRTMIPEARSPWVLGALLAVLALIGWRAWIAWRNEGEASRRYVLGAVAALAVTSLALWQLSVERAAQLILFCGDGGGMILGVALVACFYVRQEHYLHHTGLRWGFLVIGSAAFFDPARTWLRASDHDTIAFGHIEGVGDSDPSRLVDNFGWSVEALVSRYQTLLWLGAAAMLVLYLRGLWAARRLVAEERAREAAAAAAAIRPRGEHGERRDRASRPPPMAGGGTSLSR